MIVTRVEKHIIKPTNPYYQMFQSSENNLINADVNGAYNIMRKVFSDAFANGVSGVGLHPVRVNVI